MRTSTLVKVFRRFRLMTTIFLLITNLTTSEMIANLQRILLC
jgi:hypothetical protein